MANRPITPELHSLIDYGFAAGNLLLPKVLGLSAKAKTLFATFGVIQGTLNALTIQPYAAQKILPFALHGLLEKSSLPLYIAAPLVTGVAKQRGARTYWIALGVVLIAVYNLTDWDASKTGKKKRR
ncbi:hypothetical protein [Naasia lichenicola]|uniref:Uncharacterized protein n=1 Tax=Naasia lichenicola TaxID=2565933 RepID=A0A4S4FSP1_9MICO|nr:hypothetical protein [Naasia lichenicola]THG33328.1 hypothetical protein E6C64_02955 [Naasia lichenicola]